MIRAVASFIQRNGRRNKAAFSHSLLLREVRYTVDVHMTCKTTGLAGPAVFYVHLKRSAFHRRTR